MNALNKSNIYKKICKSMKDNNKIRNLKQVEDSSDYDFNCLILGVEFSFNLRSNADMLILKAVAEIENKEEQELHDYGLEITADTGINFTSYEKTLVLQKVIPLGEYSEDEAFDTIEKEIKVFVDLIDKNKEELGKDYENNEGKNIKEDNSDVSNAKKFNDENNTEEEVVENKDESVSVDLEESEDIPEGDITIGSVDEIAEAFQGMEQDKALFNNKKEKIKKDDVKTSEDTSKEIVNKTGEDAKIPEKTSYKYAPEIEEQRRELYKELNDIFKERKEQADNREHTLDKYAESLNVKEKKLNEKEEKLSTYLEEKEIVLEEKYKDKAEELENERIKLENEKQSIDFQRDRLNMEKDMFETQKKNLKEETEIREKTVNLNNSDDYSKEIKKLKEKEESLNNEIKVLQEEKNKLTINNKALNKSISKKDKEINRLKSQINENSSDNKDSKINEELRKENANLKSDLEKMNEKYEKLQRESKDKIVELEGELKASREDKDKATESYNAEKEIADKLKAEREDSLDIEKTKEKIINSLGKSGINVSEKTEGDSIVLVGAKNGCMLSVYVAEGVMICRKNVRKGSKYQKDINQWNLENVNAAYFFTDKTVMCKYYYNDFIYKAVSDVIAKMSVLN